MLIALIYRQKRNSAKWVIIRLDFAFIWLTNSFSRQAASAKQAKLAALRKWTHINPDMEEIRLELEDKILNGLLTFDLASRQASPEKDPKGKKGQNETDGGSVAGTRTTGSTPRILSDEEPDSGAESDLAPQVNELLKRARAPPKAAANVDDETNDGALSDDWPSIDGDHEEGVADSADEMEAEDEIDIAKIDETEQAPESDSPSKADALKADVDETTELDVAETAEVEVAGKRYDLGKMAEAGHGGKIMFIFQKVSNGKSKASSA